MRFFKFSILIVCATMLLQSCDNSEKEDDAALDNLMTDKKSVEISQAQLEIMDGLIKSIPTPLEISALIKDEGIKFSPHLLNPANNVQKYSTNAKRAFNLGIYGADLGYINIYDEKQEAITYLDAVLSLSDQLKMSQFFDLATIKRMATNSKDLDSLMDISTSNFEKMNAYLQEHKRGNLSAYMVLGGWIEGLNILAEVSKSSKDVKLMEKVGEQKIALGQIMLLLDIYKNDPVVAEMLPAMLDLKKIFDTIEIVQVYKEPTITNIGGIMMVQDNSSTTIKITAADIDAIAIKAKEIRNKIIG